MKFRNDCSLQTVVFAGILSFFFAAATAVPAQKIPTALKSKTDLSPISVKTYSDAVEKYKGSANEENRNRLIYLAVAQIDMNFREYQRTRRIGRDSFNILMDILELAASTATSIVNGPRSKDVINYSLTFLQGSRSSVTKNLRLLELQILFNKMIEMRSNLMITILDNVKKPHADYPFERAYLDIVAYFTAGTWDSALSALAADTGLKANQAEIKLERKRVIL